MSRFITFSQTFPAYHPKAGQPTDFVRKIWKGFVESEIISISKAAELSRETGIGDLGFVDKARLYMYNSDLPKLHTIRAGHRWKAGDYFSPRVWGDDINPKSGRSGPYQSKMITIAPDIKIEKVWSFEIKGSYIYLNSNYLGNTTLQLEPFAKNDGLTIGDFLGWFKWPCQPHFTGQIICWNKEIEY